MKSYDGATLMFNGEALHTGAVELQEMPRHGPLTFDATATTGTDAAELFGMVRREAAKPYGVVSMSIPWGILGNISVEAHVVGAGPPDVSSYGASTTFEGEMRDRDLRRAVSMAVEHAIVDSLDRETIAFEVWATDEPSVVGEQGYCVVLPSREVRRLAGNVLSKRTERKQRKAMLRLLRAAGVTVENRPDIAWLSAPLSAEEQARADARDAEASEPW